MSPSKAMDRMAFQLHFFSKKELLKANVAKVAIQQSQLHGNAATFQLSKIAKNCLDPSKTKKHWLVTCWNKKFHREHERCCAKKWNEKPF